MAKTPTSTTNRTIDDFLHGKSDHTIQLFHHFVAEYMKIGKVTIHPAMTMIGIANAKKRIAYITQLGKNFIHVVFPFPVRYDNNLCFQKVVQVPGQKQFNHHFRMLAEEDLNNEVRKFMALAYSQGE